MEKKEDGEDCEEEEEEEGLKEGERLANEMIELIFLEPGEDGIVVNPEFTHQNFENEIVDFLKEPEKVGNISVYIRCADFAHMVDVPNCSNNEERDELITRISLSLPKDATILNLGSGRKAEDKVEAFAESQSADSLGSVGPGNKIYEFKAGEDSFELWLASYKDPGASLLLSRAEQVSKWFIETSDAVNFEDDRWQCLFIMRRRHSTSSSSSSRQKSFLSIAGYFTLFRFNNPTLGSLLRVCQALVLPHLQGLGLGRETLLAIYRMARDSTDVAKVTVEGLCRWLQFKIFSKFSQHNKCKYISFSFVSKFRSSSWLSIYA